MWDREVQTGAAFAVLDPERMPGGIGPAREILNACDAIVRNPSLPATNNEAKRVLRIAVIARCPRFGTRVEEGRAAAAASLSVVETYRRRHTDPWSYIAEPLARVRTALTHNPVPAPA